MKKIKLTQGKYTLVDDADYEWLNQWKWCVIFDSNKKWYAVRAEYIGKPGHKKRHTINMHRLIMGNPMGLQVDHIGFTNTLDNRHSNLRIATKSENMRNRGRQANNTSGYKGVSWSKQNKKWYAWIGFNGKTHAIGHYDDIKQAATAYNQKALELHGEFARINKI